MKELAVGCGFQSWKVKNETRSYLFDSRLEFLQVRQESDDESDADGPFAFKRKKDCQYLAVSVLRYAA